MSATAAVDAPSGHPGGPGHDRSSPVSVGVLIWLASELMFFAGLFAAYFVLKAYNAPNWPPAGVHLDMALTVAATVLLVASSGTVHLSVIRSAAGHHRSSFNWLLLTIALGTAFVVIQAYDYTNLDFRISTNAYGSIYWILTGFHWLHVTGGIVALSMVAWVVFSRGSRAPAHRTIQVASYYWHFVDVVWIAVFVTVFLVR